jgi:glycerol-3-phosphate dehydrogenase
VIGGGIYGACALWEAVLRGYSAALVEQNDFASATSAHSLKIIHGGLRYLQSADFKRMRISTNERSTLMYIAPHLVHPLPVIVPTYGHGLRGKELLGLALRINDTVNYDRNRMIDVRKHIPDGRTLSKSECLSLLPELPEHGLTGAALFYDAQVYNSERLVLAFIESAAQIGADVANYAKVVGFLCEGDRVIGARVRDRLSGGEFEIRSRMIINCASPWSGTLQTLLPGLGERKPPALAKAINVITRPLFEDYAVGLNGDGRLYFVAPWRGYALIGTDYSLYTGHPDDLSVKPEEVHGLLESINRAYPAARLSLADVTLVHRGLLPINEPEAEAGALQLRKHPRIIDHRRDGVHGIVSVEGVKYTTARHVAVQALDRVALIWGQQPPKSISDKVPLRGAIQNFSEFFENAVTANRWGLRAETLKQLLYNYGSDYAKVLDYLNEDVRGLPAHEALRAVLIAQIHYAVHKEAALKLSDVVLRRTELGSAQRPDNDVLALCAQEMGKLLGWKDHRIDREIDEVNSFFMLSSLASV